MKTHTVIAYCFTAMFLFGISCASGDGSTGCGGTSRDSQEALLHKNCMAGGCPDRVAQCFSERWEKVSHGQHASPIARCTWFMNTYSTEHPCYSACGSCSQGSNGYERVYRMVKSVVGCQPY